jgi:hypothetical protein
MDHPAKASAWTSTGPGLPVQAPELIDYQTLANGTTLHIPSVATGAASNKINVTAQVVQVSGNAEGRISLGDGADATLTSPMGDTYCTAGSACECPQNTPRYPYAFKPMLPGTVYVGATGGLSAAQVTLTGASLAQFCGQPCPLGEWVTTNFVGNFFDSHGGAGWHLTLTKDGSTVDTVGLTVDYTGGATLIVGPLPSGTCEDNLWQGEVVESAVLSPSAMAIAGMIAATPLSTDATVIITAGTVSFTYPGTGAMAVPQSWACPDENDMTLRGAGPNGDFSATLVRAPTSAPTSP